MDNLEEKNLLEEDKTPSVNKKSKSYLITKITIVVIAALVLIIGIFGSMRFGAFKNFSMDDFIKFINAYKSIFITLTASIAGGGAVKNILKTISVKTESEGDGESLVKSEVDK